MKTDANSFYVTFAIKITAPHRQKSYFNTIWQRFRFLTTNFVTADSDDSIFNSSLSFIYSVLTLEVELVKTNENSDWSIDLHKHANSKKS